MRRRPAALKFHRYSAAGALADFVLAVAAYWLSFRIRENLGKVGEVYSSLFNHTWFIAGFCVVAAIWLLGGYHRPWRHNNTADDVRVVEGVVVGLIAFFLINRALVPVSHPVTGEPVSIPIGGIVSSTVIAILLLVGTRIGVRSFAARRLLLRNLTGKSDRPIRGALIVGAGEGGRIVAKEMLRNPQLGLRPLGFVDDNPHIQRTRIDGLEVYGSTDELPKVLDQLEPDELIIAIPSAPGTLRASVLRSGRSRGVPVRTLPTTFELLQASEGQVVRQAREIQVEDVLGREPVVMELDRVGAFLQGKRVMVTGAGGSIGSELCRQIARVGPAHLILLDHAEDNLFQIWRELAEDRQVPESLMETVVGDVKDGERIRDVLRAHRPEIVFHAAAYKHVGLMEENPVEAVRNNAIATRTMARLCGEAKVERFVLISTDKAVAPATVMGASKALAELAIESAAQRWPDTRFSCVRFGNVLGSSGSVVPIFQRQIARGGPVTVTDERMTRYFMTIPEAVQLVIQAGSLGRTGEILVLDMGEPVSIMQLAHDMIELSGLRPETDIAIEIVGPRPGEKIDEDLVNDFENLVPTTAPRISQAQRTPLPPEVIEEMFDQIGLLVLNEDVQGLADKVAELQQAAASPNSKSKLTDSSAISDVSATVTRSSA